jgi:hypothetical protein
MLTPIIRRVIALSAAIEEYDLRELANGPPPPAGFHFHPVDLSDCHVVPPLPEELELRNLLASLSPAQLCLLTVVMLIGRGDFDPDEDILDLYCQVSDTLRACPDDIDYLAAKPLCLYLSDGLRLLTERHIDVDALLKPARNP